MKNLLVVFGLFLISSSVLADDQRFTTLHRTGPPVAWDEKTGEFPQVLKLGDRRGNLSVTRVKPIESIHPYATEAGRLVSRAALIDDLYYEPLMLADPTGGTERMYPLIARAVRVAGNYSTVIFEIDPRARFQDGTPVTGSDILTSIEVMKSSSPALRAKTESIIKTSTASQSEVRFELNISGQAARNALMFLAGVKIVKVNSTGATTVGGIAVKYSVTGPYRLTQLGRSRLSLITDPAYWGRELAVRRGFFNFRLVEVLAYVDETAARLSVANDTANFFFESQTAAALSTSEYLKQRNARLIHSEENVSPGGRIPSWSFNINSPAVADPRTRQAILLAYDFDGINQLHFGGTLRRPLSLLEATDLAPKAEPSDAVKALMATCGVQSAGPFESHGHAQYASILDKRIRLLTAMRLLQEAGFKIENGVLKRAMPDGTLVPLQLRILVRENELRSANLFRGDLLRLGILVQVTSAENAAFKGLRDNSDFELVSGGEGFLDKEARPSPERLEIPESQNLTCVREMVRVMESEDPQSEAFRTNAEALARVHQALHFSIFTGAPTKNNFFFDGRLHVPGKLPVANIHMYGYFLEPEAPAEQQPWPAFFNYQYNPYGNFDIGTIFGLGR